MSIHDKKMEFYIYDGSITRGLGKKIDVSDIVEGGVTNGAPLGELGNTLAKGVYNEDKNGFALLDYKEEPGTNTTTVTFACAIKRDNSALPLVDKKYQGLDIYEVKFSTNASGAVITDPNVSS